MEVPLLDSPGYDTLVIQNPRGMFPGCRGADSSQTQSQAVLDWAAQRKTYPPYIHYELKLVMPEWDM